ncbi:MAG: polysaccharide deacetylase family protein [Planctomycetia bacterium]|nr:polysaccharide deacetylase family protein [Planctomycetia bacterium]MCC7313555.1 glycoside hydrolase family 57 protein [Planctomycetota bacterium]
MASVCFYFQVHQPFRLRRYSIFDADHNYFDDYKNAEICRKVATKCYLPANQCILDMIRVHEGRFRCSYSLTGVVLDQFEAYCPEVIESFKRLADTGCVEFLAETYYHSLAFLFSRAEFEEQVALQQERIGRLFGQKSTVFRNTELIYNNDVAAAAHKLGYKAIIAEGADHLLGYRSPNFVYKAPSAPITVLLKNYRLSDDIAFRFGNRSWAEWPLTAEKFAKWVNQVNGNGYAVNLFMDYETFGEHQWTETGIFEFLYHMPGEVMKISGDNNFMKPSEIVSAYEPSGEYDCPHLISWADTERDLSAWLGNAMQSNALQEAFALEGAVKAKGDAELLSDWRRLLTSDHFYYMCTKYFADGDVHKYFNPYESPYDSYINYMNVLDNVAARSRQSLTAPLNRPAR